MPLAANQLTITPAANFAGSFVVEVTATDGALTTRRAFQVTVTDSAPALSSSLVAFNLKQSLGLTYTGNYWTNYYGLQEKRLENQSGKWYCLLPNGELRRAGTSAAAMLMARSLVATLDSSFYTDPSLLWNAQAGAAVPVTATVAGS